MEILLISKVDKSQLFILNVITNTLFSCFEKKTPSISLILISNTKVEDNFLFVDKKYTNVEYIKRFNQLKKVNKKEYDYLISIENSLIGLVISAKVNAKLKAGFKRAFGFIVFGNLIAQKKKIGFKHLSICDAANLVKHVFSYTKELIPKYHNENPLVRKNHEMIHWIFYTNYSIDLANVNYILMDLHFGDFQQSRTVEMVGKLCDQLIRKFKLKIIFLSNQLDEFDVIMNSSEILTRENFIYNKQNLNSAIANFPLMNHSSLIVTNKLRNTPFLDLINKPYYLIKEKNTLLKLFYPIPYFNKLTKKTIGEINYMLKSI